MENVKYTLLFLLVVVGVAHAAAEVKTVGDIDRLQSGRVLYEAQAAYNKAKNEAGEGGALSLPVAPVQGVTPGVTGAAATAVAPGNALPSLEKVVGQEATLRLADGSMTAVRAGDTLDGLTVVSVSVRGVVVRRKADNKLITLN
ncbi:conjugal transfer protein [Pantoea ananatis 15320]|uniref:type IV pilus biogenesis protein PilP n=1 Tax=Pantoea ananas TaxID=553 RepID=UPI000402E8CF|nr:type IV pilus biogenesis protein PilP [Pantoea ananatis]PKC36300.1 conjugal transfer protein [Pantoea ananatis 15320]